VKTENGESDLELTFRTSADATKVLVENKIDAPLQPDQAERYFARAERYSKSRRYGRVLTVLVAPRKYLGEQGGQLGFDAAITYEAIRDQISRSSDPGPRIDYKNALLDVAIRRAKVGWTPQPNRRVETFWQQYWKLAREIAPQLSMPRPRGIRPARSQFIEFRPAGLPPGVKLKHKVNHGNVDLQFAGMGARRDELELRYGRKRPSGAQFEGAGKSAVVRLAVTPIDMTKADFDTSTNAIREGIEAAARLLAWYQTVHESKRVG